MRRTRHVTTNRLRRSAAGLGALTALFATGLYGSGSAYATSATATLGAGSLAFVSSPPAVSFSGTLTGVDQTLSSTQALDIGDATGSASGWDVTATSTTFTTGGSETLSTSATTISSTPSDACDSGSSCALASNSITYPYTLPAGATAPTATKVFDSATGSGMGDQTVTPTWKLAVPADAYAGTYNSTWTLSLVSGP